MLSKRIAGPLDKRRLRSRCQACSRRKIKASMQAPLTNYSNPAKCQGGQPCEYCTRVNISCVRAPNNTSLRSVTFISMGDVLSLAGDRDSVYVGHFHTFTQRCQFSVHFSRLHDTLRPMAANAPYLRDVIIAIGALNASRLPSARVTSPRMAPSAVAYKYYDAAIRGLNGRISANTDLHDTSLLWGTFLLGLFEVGWPASRRYEPNLSCSCCRTCRGTNG